MDTIFVIFSTEIHFKYLTKSHMELSTLTKTLRHSNIGYQVKMVQERDLEAFNDYQLETYKELPMFDDFTKVQELISNYSK